MYGDFKYLYPKQGAGELSKPKKYSDRDVFNEEFGWYNHLYEAAGGKLIDIPTILKMEYRLFLQFSNYTIRKKTIEGNEVRNMYKK